MRLKPDMPWFSTVVLAWMMIACFPVNAQQDILRVLILNSYDESSAPYFQPVEEFKIELQRNYSSTIVFQDVELRQRGKQTQSQTDQSIAQLLVSRYGSAPPQLVVATGPPAIDFWIQYRDSTFPDALLVATSRESYFRQAKIKPADAMVVTRFSFTGVVENILQLLPQTSQIVMVFGDSLSERTLAEGARQQLAPYSDRLKLTFTNDRTIPKIQDLLAGLPDGAVVFFGVFSKDMHDMSYRLHPSLVEDLGIDAALYSEIERVQRQTSVPISVRVGEISRQIPAEIALCVFRIAQEALQNAVKYAGASAIEINLEQSDQGLMLTVHDNGVGFNVAKVSDRFSLGLSSMHERATLLNGSLNIKSRPGEGTIVTFIVPNEGMRK